MRSCPSSQEPSVPAPAPAPQARPGSPGALPTASALIAETAQLSTDALAQRIGELAAHLAAAMCRWLLLVAEFDARGGFAEQGAKSCAHWLSWCCGIGLRAARDHVRVARRLLELPLICQAFAAGELSYSKVRALTRVASQRTEESLLMIARHATGAQLERLVGGYASVLAAEDGAHERAHERRRLDFEWQADGTLRLTAALTPDDGALVLAALQAASAQPVSTAAERADALVAVARAALEAADGAGGSGGNRCELVVHVDVESLAGERIAQRCELEDGPAIAPETARRLACDAALVRIVERDGRPLSVGRRTRTISPALRRALRSRDGGCCAFPGCDHRRFLHAHHVRHWARGGPTELGNLVQLCSHHHRLVHEGGFQVRRIGRGGFAFHTPDGRLIPPSVSGRRARGPALEARNWAAGLRLDADSCRPRSAGQPLDYDLAVAGLAHAELARAAPS